MNKIFLTATREFKATALTKAFFFGAVVLPIVIWGVLGAASAIGLFNQQPEPTVGVIAMVDPTPDSRLTDLVATRLDPETQKARIEAMRAEVEARLDGMGSVVSGALEQASSFLNFELARITVETLAPGVDLDPVRQRVRDGELLALVEVSDETMAPGGSFASSINESIKARDIDLIKNAVANSVVDLRLENEGMSAVFVRALIKRPNSKTKTLTESGETAGSEILQRVLPMVFLMFLAISIFTGGSYLLMSTVEEKSSRVMEVLLSSMSPMQLMTGKIIGQGLVGLLLLLIYGGLGIFAAIQFSVMGLIPPSLLAWLVVYFFMGYFIYAGIFAAIGSAVNDAREAQTLQGPIMGVTILVMYLGVFSVMISDNPNSMLAQVLSFFPPATPFVMVMRLAYTGDTIPMWQIITTTIVGFGGVVASVWFAAKIFRVGVLMYGQPPSLLGLFKWIRYA